MDNYPEGKNLIFSAYTFLIISRIFKEYPDKISKAYFKELLEKDYLISFKIHFILKYIKAYGSISKDFYEICQGLHFINIFYNEIFSGNHNIRISKDNIINKYIFGKDKFILSFDNNYINYNIDNLFIKEDNEIFSEVFDKISYFYSIEPSNIKDIYNLIHFSSEKNDNFILSIVEHIYQKRKYIFNNFFEYQNNLKKLEKQIFDLGKDTLNINKINKSINKYSINDEQKLTFNSLLNKINQNINNIFKGKFNLYPVGSTTEFLASNNSDLDLYLDISQIKKNDKIAFIFHLKDIISKIINQDPDIYISRRLCVILFKCTCFNGKETYFDISVLGIRSYFHSILFRTYSLI